MAADSAVIAGDVATLLTQNGQILLGLVDGNTALIQTMGGNQNHILDNNDEGGERLNIRTTTSAVVISAGAIGRLTDCIEIAIGTTMTATAGGTINGTAISFCGTTADGDIDIPGPQPGLIIFNGIEELNDLRNARTVNEMNELADPTKRKYLWVLQLHFIDDWIWLPEVVIDERKLRKPGNGQ
jgi:hypothetical protein